MGAYIERARRNAPGPNAAATAATTARTTAAAMRHPRAFIETGGQPSSIVARRGKPFSWAMAWTVSTFVSAIS